MTGQRGGFFMGGRKVLVLAAVAAIGMHHGAAQAAEEVFSPAQKEALGAFIKEYLVAHPDVVVEALTEYQKNQESSEQALFTQKYAEKKDAILNGGAPFAGDPKGDVTVVEFFDYNCGYCKKATEDIVKLVETDKKVKIIFIDMPILSPASLDAARWALAAGKQGKYYEYHVALMQDPGPKNEAGFTAVAERVGLDAAKMKKDADGKDIREAIEKNLALGRELGIRGTPGFIIGDMLAPGYIGFDSMKAGIDAVRQGKK